MEIKKVEFLPVVEPKNTEVLEVVKKFKASKMKHARVEREQGETEYDIRKKYNSLYQACKREKGVKVTRIYGEIYLCKTDKQGDEV